MSDSPVSRGLSLLAAIAWLPLPGQVSTVFERALYELRMLEAAYERQAKELRFQRERAAYWCDLSRHYRDTVERVRADVTDRAVKRIAALEHERDSAMQERDAARAAHARGEAWSDDWGVKPTEEDLYKRNDTIDNYVRASFANGPVDWRHVLFTTYEKMRVSTKIKPGPWDIDGSLARVAVKDDSTGMYSLRRPEGHPAGQCHSD